MQIDAREEEVLWGGRKCELTAEHSISYTTREISLQAAFLFKASTFRLHSITDTGSMPEH